MKNRFFICLTVILMPFVANAQSLMARVFESMPDSMITYLDKGQRTELADDFATSKSAVVVNNLGDTTKLDNMTADYLLLECNKARVMEMKLLPRRNNTDTVLCVVNTYKGPAEESEISFYDTSWNKLKGMFNRPVLQSALLQKPDTLSQADFDELSNMLDPLLIKLSLSPDDRSLTFKLSIPDVPSDKRKQLEGLTSQTKLNWNGEKFN